MLHYWPLVHTFTYAGILSKLIFAFGIIGLGLLAIPVLSGSAAYALTEAFNMKEGLNLKLKKAHGFYGIITIATLIGLMINFIGIDPIKALVFTAEFNGVAAVPLIFIIARNPKIMGKYRSGWLSNTVVWITFVVMLASAVAMFYTLSRGQTIFQVVISGYFLLILKVSHNGRLSYLIPRWGLIMWHKQNYNECSKHKTLSIIQYVEITKNPDKGYSCLGLIIVNLFISFVFS